MSSLNKKTCVVTGGGSGIGKATVLALAGLGARVAVVGRTKTKLTAVVDEVNSTAGEAVACAVDVSDWDAVSEMKTELLDRWGRVDVLVNNAGINVSNRGTLDTEPYEIEKLISINLTGTIFCARAMLPTMLEQGEGTIINVSSNAALWPGMMSGMSYAAGKAGVNNFTKFLNDELQHTNIRACVISPGEVVTPILDLRSKPPAEEARQAMCLPEDVAASIVFAITLPARAMVTEMVIVPTVSRDMSSETVSRPGAP